MILLMLILMIVGGFSAFTMPRESTPEIKIPFASVMTAYSGASPQEVADQVTFKIEQEIKGLEGVEEMTSVSSENFSMISVQFDAQADIDSSIRKLKDHVDLARSKLPLDAEDPIVNEVSFSNRPVITFGFFGDVSYENLLHIAEDTGDALEKISGVQRTDIIGKRDKHILIAVREVDMRRFGMNLRQIAGAIQSFNLNAPVGNVEIDELLYRVRIQGEQETVQLIENIPLLTSNNATVYVKDVANVREEFKPAQTKSLISIHGQPALSAITLSLVKKTGANVIRTVDEAKQVVQDLKMQGVIPEQVEILTINDFSEFVREDFDNLLGSAKQTIVLIFIVLFLALGLKEALIAGLAVPFTFLIAFIYLKATGNTLNSIVLFALILGLGLLVDTAIVMMEGIHDNLYKKNMPPLEAALKAVKMYRFPLISGTLTTVAAFSPMLLMRGIMGQFFAYIPRTVNVVLLSSLFIGLLVIPAFAVLFLKSAEEKKKSQDIVLVALRQKVNAMFAFLNQKYSAILAMFLNSKRRRKQLYLGFAGLFTAALLLPVIHLIPIEGFPLVDADFMYVNVEAPLGTALQKTEKITEKVEEIIRHKPYIKNYTLNLGMSLDEDLSVSQSNTHKASFTLNLTDKDSRDLKAYEIAKQLKEEFKVITEADVKAETVRSGPPSGATIQVRLFGDDFKALGGVTRDVSAELKRLGGDQVDDDINTGTAEFTFNFQSDYSKAFLKNHNLTIRDVGQEVRMAVYPTKIISLKREDEELDIDIQREWDTENNKPHSIESIKNIPIQNAKGEYVSLDSLVSPTIGTSVSSIRHFDTKQAITVSADPKIGETSDALNRGIKDFLDNYDWPKGYSYQLTGGNADTEESFNDLFKALFMGILLIFLILTTQFDSFKQPFMIMTAVPLSLIGVLFGFLVFRLTIGVGSFIGIVALSGIVVNDAIVLMDRINVNRRKKGLALKEAIQEAGPARMQPILITSITTIFGVLPITFTDPFWLTLGSSIIFGLMFSTILTLLVVPLLYYSWEK